MTCFFIMYFSAMLALSCLNLLILWWYPKSLAPIPYSLHQQDACINICLLCPVLTLVLWQHIFHFFQVIYSLCSASMTAIRKWERNTAWWWWHWQGTNVTSDFLVNLYSKCCPPWLRMSDCKAAGLLIPRLEVNCSEWWPTPSFPLRIYITICFKNPISTQV